jgi:anti-anti-sigma factor
MEIQVVELNSSVTGVRLAGRLDAPGADLIGIKFSAAVASPGRHAVVDLSGVSFLASMGIRLLISTARALHQKGARMVLFGAQGPVRSVLEEMAVDQIVPLVDTEQDALAQLSG